MRSLLLASVAIVLAMPAYAGGKNTNVNTNVNINTAKATAKATATSKVNINIKNSAQGGSASAAGGGGWADSPASFGPGSAANVGGGGGSSGAGGGVYFNQPDAGGNWGLYPNTLDTGHAIKRSLPSKGDWTFDLTCKTPNSTLRVAVNEKGDGDMLVTETDPMGITWDRFEQYGDISLKKIADGMYEWKGRRNGSPGVQLTGTVIKTKDGRYLYIEDLDIAGGTRPFTDAKCTVRQ